jgi:hypothetical protein
MMEYFIKSGFGIAKEPSFRGSINARLMGLGQGSGATPIGMRSMITLVDNAYKRLGHGINAKFSLADRIFILAAIIYVDDTDLLHWAKFYGLSNKSFMDDIQKGVNDWGMLVQATGGSLKQSKSFWYLFSWKFVRGKPTIKPETELPLHPLTIPLPDGSSLPIEQKPLHHTAETLGVWKTPLNDPRVGLAKLKKKGLDWVDCFRVRPLSIKETPGSVSHLSSTPSGPMASPLCMPIAG